MKYLISFLALIFATPATAAVLWSANMETGNISQWGSGSSQDTSPCTRSVTRERPHTGNYSLKLTINTSNGKAACRQHRNDEAQTGRTLYYSAWFYYPRSHFPVNEHWNIFQFKSGSPSHSSQPFWTIETTRNPLTFALNWKGGHTGSTSAVRGPFSNSSAGAKEYRSSVRTPIGRWFKIEAYLDQSPNFDGTLRVWIDGNLVWNFNNVRTQWPNGNDQRWSVNNYSNGLNPDIATIFIDDAQIRTP